MAHLVDRGGVDRGRVPGALQRGADPPRAAAGHRLRVVARARDRAPPRVDRMAPAAAGRVAGARRRLPVPDLLAPAGSVVVPVPFVPVAPIDAARPAAAAARGVGGGCRLPRVALAAGSEAQLPPRSRDGAALLDLLPRGDRGEVAARPPGARGVPEAEPDPHVAIASLGPGRGDLDRLHDGRVRRVRVSEPALTRGRSLPGSSGA